MYPRMMNENIFAVGAFDWDRTLFDALIPLPYGTTYNAYLIKGSKKTVLIDTVDPSKLAVLKRNLNNLNIDRLDYIISNHAEQDHSGSIPEILNLYPMARLLTGKKGQDMLLPLLDISPERIQVVEDREILSLGDKTLQFIFAPWVHWPETMFTFAVEDKILFSCDLFGAHLASSELFASKNENTLQEAKRYYAEIMMPYGGRIVKHLETLQNYDIKTIAPSHGPVYDHPEQIMSAYHEWVTGDLKNEVVIIYVTMHGSTEQLVFRLTDELVKRNISVTPFNTVTASLGDLALSLVDAKTVILGSPAYLMGAHPNLIYAAYLINTLKPRTQNVGIIGSFGWGNKMVNQLTDMLKDLTVEYLPPLLVKGNPRQQDYLDLVALAEKIQQVHQS
ncbi:MAG: FprA family A-type flavoprotein [bacterium]|nr:MAG: FprA family A-type flavoprotein [bacterium]